MLQLGKVESRSASGEVAVGTNLRKDDKEKSVVAGNNRVVAGYEALATAVERGIWVVSLRSPLPVLELADIIDEDAFVLPRSAVTCACVVVASDVSLFTKSVEERAGARVEGEGGLAVVTRCEIGRISSVMVVVLRNCVVPGAGPGAFFIDNAIDCVVAIGVVSRAVFSWTVNESVNTLGETGADEEIGTPLLLLLLVISVATLIIELDVGSVPSVAFCDKVVALAAVGKLVDEYGDTVLAGPDEEFDVRTLAVLEFAVELSTP